MIALSSKFSCAKTACSVDLMSTLCFKFYIWPGVKYLLFKHQMLNLFYCLVFPVRKSYKWSIKESKGGLRSSFICFVVVYLIVCSPELKAQVSYSDRLLSIIRLAVRLLHFRLLLQTRWANCNQRWHKLSLGKGDSDLFIWRATPYSKGR
jgi:hypothetical protein